MIFKKYTVALGLAIASLSANAQMPCGTTQVVNKALELRPQGVLEQQQLEDFTQNFNPTGERATKIIPVVVHIIHNYGPENISKEQVLDAISILNRDFQLLNIDTANVVSTFKGRVAAPNFQFRLAKLDPNGNCTDGITRTASELTFTADDNVKDLISWPTNKYFNIWVVDKISFEAGGYAYLPGTSPCNGCDGVVVVNTQFGGIGTSFGSNFSSRTLTHEAGHWFNLNHTWGSNNNCGSSCSGTDNVNDTPKTSGACLECNLSQSDCGVLANVQNFMDYSTCAVMFTTGQSTRMLAAVNSNIGGRSNLWSNANLIATGVNDGYTANPCAPVADFLYDNDRVCAGNTVNFTDISYGADVDQTWTWSWTLPGANPSTSTNQNPTVTYVTPGTYNVSLTATNISGNSSVTKNQIIKVLPSTGLAIAPLIEGIENSQFPTEPSNSLLNWEITPGSGTWARTTNAAATGSASILIRGAQLTADQKYDLISPVVNLTNVAQSPLFLTFKVAYRYNGTAADVLKVYVSDNCGETWQARYSKTGAQLGTVSQGSSNFVPASGADWRTETVNINGVAGEDGALIRFEFTAAGGGQNLYIDDINIGGAVVSLNEQTANGLLLNVYPNPITSQTVISLNSKEGGKATITLVDMTGRIITAQNIGLQANSPSTIELNSIAPTLPAGIYNLRMQIGDSMVNRRVVVN